MKSIKNIILIVLYIFTSFGSLNARNAEDIIKQREVKKFNYFLSTGLMKAVVINMQYGQAEVISNSDRTAMKTAEVFRVDLVFSDFPSEYDMESLNLKRIRLIQKLRPDLVKDEKVQWRLIRQMRCKNAAEAKTLFHGIVIHYRPVQSKDIMEVDTRFLLTNLPVSDSIRSVEKLRKLLVDTSVIHIMNRNKKRWKNMVVVTDLTGSMSPYASQVILWLKLSSIDNKVSSVTFFNDGDMKHLKPIGSTGGIYMKRTTDYDEIRELALITVRAGNGGDGPENDCEALIATQKFNPNAKEMILIADNMAPIKDKVLIGQILKPVRVVLCGTTYGINIEYLNLARDTGGSVHTMEKDLTHLLEMEEGKTFSLNNIVFKIVNNRIIQFSKT